MKEILEDLLTAANKSSAACMATVVRTEGTAPRKEGAKMLVAEGRPLSGTMTIGGCVDSQVIEAAEEVTRAGRPQLIRVDLGEEDAFEIGLTCAGTLHIFVEPLRLNSEILAQAKRLLDQGQPFALLGVTRSTLPEIKPGSKAIVSSEGEMSGSLGNAELNNSALELARANLSSGISRTIRLDHAF